MTLKQERSKYSAEITKSLIGWAWVSHYDGVEVARGRAWSFEGAIKRVSASFPTGIVTT